MTLCKKKGYFHRSTYGTRQGRNALDPIFIKEFENEIVRASRQVIIRFLNDAASCYDRILIYVSSLSNRAYGMHRKVVQVHSVTLDRNRYHIKTSLGVSLIFIAMEMFRVFGTGQGSANSPSIWEEICSILFECHESISHGASFCSINGKDKVTFTMIGFVDDCTGRVNLFNEPGAVNLQELVNAMQQDAQNWWDLLWM